MRAARGKVARQEIAGAVPGAPDHRGSGSRRVHQTLGRPTHSGAFSIRFVAGELQKALRRILLDAAAY